MVAIGDRLWPPRRSAFHIRHSLTYSTACVYPATPLWEVSTHRLEFLWRAAAGSLGLGGVNRHTCPANRRLQSRSIQPAPDRRQYYSSLFRRPQHACLLETQQAPILIALCQSFVLKEFWNVVTALFMFSDESEDSRVRHGVVAALKARAGSLTFNQICTQHVRFLSLPLHEPSLGIMDRRRLGRDLPCVTLPCFIVSFPQILPRN